jgi:hypothetical protein
MAALLVPSYKLCWFDSEHLKQQAKTWLLEEACRCAQQQSGSQAEGSEAASGGSPLHLSQHDAPVADDAQSAQTTASHGQGNTKSNYDWKDELWQEITAECPVADPASVQRELREVAVTELTRYLELSLAPRHPATDPINGWRANASIFPTLAPVARKFLYAPASSVSSERLFSAAGLIITDCRSCLDSANTEMLLFLNKNLLQFGSCNDAGQYD